MNVPLALLGLLTVADFHGYDLKQLYDRVISPGRPLKQGQVYATLQRLERDGNIAMVAVEKDEGPERRRFGLTARGKREVQDWLDRPEEPAPYLQSELFAKVLIAVLAGASVHQLLDTQRAAHLERMRELTRQRREGSLPGALLADFSLFHLEADLRWLEVTAGRIDQLASHVRTQVGDLGVRGRGDNQRTANGRPG
jgi:DNA-binding PadR family transcriptional regulator